MKVLIPVDGSEPSLWTIREAGNFLDKRAAEIYLFMVLVPVAAEIPWGFYAIDEEEGANTALRIAESEAMDAGLRVVKTDHATFYEPASAICDYARTQGMDLIVIGSHGYRGVEKLLMGSVSERVFKQAEQPVIIVRNDKAHTVEISHFEKTGLRQAT